MNLINPRILVRVINVPIEINESHYMGVGNGGRVEGALAPPPSFSANYIYNLNGVVLMTMKELNFTKDVLKYNAVGTSFRLRHRVLCFN